MPRLPVRQLIYDEVFSSRPAFQPVESRWPYAYRRRREDGVETFYDIVAMWSSQKYHAVGASVAWGIFPYYEGDLGRHELRAASGLPYLAGRRTLDEEVYVYDGTEDGARAALRRVAHDLQEVAEPWFLRLTAEMLVSPLVRLGLEWVRSHPESQTAKQGFAYDQQVREELSRVLRRRAFELQLDPKIKKNISLLTYHLLEFASDVEGQPGT